MGCLWLKLRIWCEAIRVVPIKTAGRVWGRPPGRAVSRTSPNTPPAAAVTEGPAGKTSPNNAFTDGFK